MSTTPNSFNFSVSGWTGSGSTSLSFILCKLFSFKYLHMGGVFRYIGQELGHSEEGVARPKFDDYIEPIIGHTIDKYRDHVLLESENYVLDSDLGTFLVGKHPRVFSIFLKSSFEERSKKVVKEEREDAEAILIERDKVNQAFYLDLHGFDIYDEDLIAKKFTLVIDNSHVSIEEEVRMVLEELKSYSHINQGLDFDKLKVEASKEIKSFAELNKSRYKETLEELGLVVSAEETVMNIAKQFPEDVAGFPENIQKIFLGLQD